MIMNELTNLTSTLQQLPLFYIGIGLLFILLLFTKNNFSQPPALPHKSHSSILAIFTFLFAILPAGYFGWSFYQLYFPDFKYEEVSATVDFHIFQPKYLPPQIQQQTTFHQTEVPEFNTSPTIRVYYGKNISQLIADKQSQVIVIDQSKTPTPFSFILLLENRTKEMESQVKIAPIQITSFPNAPAYLVSNQIVTSIWIHTNDGVLISITSQTARTPTDELIKIAESLY